MKKRKEYFIEGKNRSFFQEAFIFLEEDSYREVPLLTKASRRGDRGGFLCSDTW